MGCALVILWRCCRQQVAAANQDVHAWHARVFAAGAWLSAQGLSGRGLPGCTGRDGEVPGQSCWAYMGHWAGKRCFLGVIWPGQASCIDIVRTCKSVLQLIAFAAISWLDTWMA